MVVGMMMMMRDNGGRKEEEMELSERTKRGFGEVVNIGECA